VFGTWSLPLFSIAKNSDILLEDYSGSQISQSNPLNRETTLRSNLKDKSEDVSNKISSRDDKETPSVTYSRSSARAISIGDKMFSVYDGWTEISKDLVSREALDSVNEDYQDTGQYFRINRVMNRSEIHGYVERSKLRIPREIMPTYGRNVNRFFDVPLTNNPFFTGRQYHLSKLDEIMYPITPTPTSNLQLRCAILVGLGGSGKTEIAVRYAHIHRPEFLAVLWIDGTSRNSLLESFLRIAHKLRNQSSNKRAFGRSYSTSSGRMSPGRTPPGRTSSGRRSPVLVSHGSRSSVDLVADIEDDVAVNMFTGKASLPKVIEWLNSAHHRHDWLMIIDNMDDPSMVGVIEDLLAQLNRGFALITTRNSRASRLGTSMDVGEFEEEEASEFLLRSVGLWEQPSTSGPCRVQADNLCQLLGYLALAIDQAAAYINENGLLLDEYIDLYQQEKAYLLNTASNDRYLRTRSADLDKKYDTVLLTWEISFQFIEKESPASALLLQLLAFMDHEEISEDLFQAIYIAKAQWSRWTSTGAIVKSDWGKSGPAQILIQGMGSKPKFHEVVGKLLAFSLVKRTAKRRCLSIHPVSFHL
jgi:hypothetical protein